MSFSTLLTNPPPLPLVQMGNLLPITYGGHLLALLFQPITLNAPLPHSVLGHYLLPTAPSVPLDVMRKLLRSSASFTTETVTFSQNGRSTAYFILDAHKLEPSSLHYSVSPSQAYTPPSELPPDSEIYQNSELYPMFEKIFGSMFRYFDTRTPPQSYYATNMFGLLKALPTSQDHLMHTQKRAAIYYRCKEKLTLRHQHYAAIAYILDSALAFMPATFAHLFMDDFKVLSTLSVSLHFHTERFDVNEWFLHECGTEQAGCGRTFSTGRIFQGGQLVATMVQSSIARGGVDSKL
jgi:acyl-CoA thioesterase II